jgi:hypothetical protein
MAKTIKWDLGTNNRFTKHVPVWLVANPGFPPDYYKATDKTSKSKRKNNEFHFIFAIVCL